MPKARKKRVKHQDFAKVKLKVGKKLPRAANETDASFQSRSVQIKEQFHGDRSDIQEPTTKRKLVLGDLLSQCQHYSTSMKHDALVGLRELLSGSPHLIGQNLRVVLERIAELFVDKDPVIRKDAHRLLKTVLPAIQLQRVTPFFPVISAHLCCAMTHINEDIQSDSLQVLDLLIESFPELVVANSSRLLPNFVEQISKESPSNKKVGSRTLTVNPGGKLGSHKWRVRVLDRLNKLLTAVVNSKMADSALSDKTQAVHAEPWRSSCGYAPLRNLVLNSSKGFKLRDQSVVKSDGGTDTLSASSLQTYAMTLVPLLLDCWIEVGPSQLTSQLEGNVLSQDALLTLQNVLGVLVLLLQYSQSLGDLAENKEFLKIKSTYSKDFVKYFMTHFPYAMHAKTGKKASKQDKTQLSVVSINLLVCELMTYFLDGSDTDWTDTVVAYICELLTGCRLSGDQLRASLGIIHKVIHGEQTDVSLTERLLSAVFSLYKNKSSRRSELHTLLGFFSRLYGDSHGAFRRSEIYSPLLQSLPGLLQKLCNQGDTSVSRNHTSVSRNHGDTSAGRHHNDGSVSLLLGLMKAAGVQREACYLATLEDGLPQLTDTSVISALKPEQQRHLVEMLYNVRRWTRQNLAVISRLLLHNGLETDTQLYLLETLNQRVLRSNFGCLSSSDYLSFLFTIILGQSREDLGSVTPQDSDSQFVITCDNEEKKFESHMKRAKIAVNHCLSVLDGDTIVNLWSEFVTKFLENHKTFPLPTSVSVIATFTLLHSSTEQSKLCSLIGQLIVDTMVTVHSSVTMATSVQSSVTRVTQDCLCAVPGLWAVIADGVKTRSTEVTEAAVLLDMLQKCVDVNRVMSERDLRGRISGPLSDLIASLLGSLPSLAETPQYTALQYTVQLLASSTETDAHKCLLSPCIKY